MFLAEAAAAAYYARSEDSVARTESSPLWVSKRDPELGYALNPGVRVSASRTMGDSALYRVTYTTTDDGVRRTRGNVHGDTWLFMGCSFTFGDGVEDDETLPSRFSEQLGWNANVVNLGVSGYGAHQVLRLLETGRLGGAAPPVKHVIYQAIQAHVARTAGRFRWNLDGPAYTISGDTVRYDGPLHGRTFVRAFRLAERSDLLRLLISRFYLHRKPTAREIEVYGRIVERAGALAREKLGARFTVLYWDTTGLAPDPVLERLVATRLPIVRATSLVPLSELNRLRIPHDRHPTAEAYRRLAAGLAAHLGETSKKSVAAQQLMR